MFQEGKLSELSSFAQAALDRYPKSLDLWKVFGAALGGAGRTKEARRAFLAALELAPNDPIAIANYITSCFHDGDGKSATDAIELYFDELPNEVQTIVLNSLGEAIQAGLVSEAALPPVILSLFENEKEILGDLEFDPGAGSNGGKYDLNKKEIKEVMQCLDNITQACAQAKKAIKKSKLTVVDAETIYNLVEDSLVEMAVILDGALD